MSISVHRAALERRGDLCISHGRPAAGNSLLHHNIYMAGRPRDRSPQYVQRRVRHPLEVAGEIRSRVLGSRSFCAKPADQCCGRSRSSSG